MIPSILKITHKIEMSKRREPLDRLSELPDSLVLSILSLLPMRDVVMTTLLSKRFKDLWTTVPCLNFKSDLDDYDDNDKEEDGNGNMRYYNTRFQNFVNRALIIWRGTKILEFKVEMFFCEWPPFRDLDVWLRVALENEVEKLYVNLLTLWEPCENQEFTEYCPPQRLYSCSSIRELHLACCKLKINGNVQWDQLKYLKIVGVSLSEHVMNQIVSGSPQLEVLSLSLSEVYEGLNIHSISLKALKIEKFNDKSVRSVLTIWAPNLETLEILGNPYGKYVMKNVSSLTNATVDIDFVAGDGDVDGDGGGDGNYFSGYVLFEDILRKAYETNGHVEKVSLSDQCIKMLEEMKKQGKRMFEPLSDAKFLKLYGNYQVDELKGLLTIFPKLAKLVLENGWKHRKWIHQISWSTKDPSIPKFDTDNSFKSRKNSVKSCLLHLTTVEIEWNASKDSLPIVNYFLRNCSKLEKLFIQVRNSMQYTRGYLLRMADKVLKIPRLSPTAEVIICRE